MALSRRGLALARRIAVRTSGRRARGGVMTPARFASEPLELGDGALAVLAARVPPRADRLGVLCHRGMSDIRIGRIVIEAGAH